VQPVFGQLATPGSGGELGVSQGVDSFFNQQIQICFRIPETGKKVIIAVGISVRDDLTALIERGGIRARLSAPAVRTA
jgi:hypothetical protein